MRNTVMLLEKVLREKLSSDKYTLRLNSTKSGNLPNRAPFIRKVYRQTTLDEFNQSGMGTMKPVSVKEIVYTVHARYLREDKIGELHDALLNDLNLFMYKHR